MVNDAKVDQSSIRPRPRGLFIFSRALPVAALALGLTLVFPASMAAADEGTSSAASTTVQGQEPAETDTSQGPGSGSEPAQEPSPESTQDPATQPAPPATTDEGPDQGTSDPATPDPVTNSGPGTPAEEPPADDATAADSESAQSNSGAGASQESSTPAVRDRTRAANGGRARAPQPKVTICHRTNSHTNPYNQITVAIASANFQGHTTHTGPIFHPGIQGDWGDIIPPVPGFESGLNWPEGQSILDNGCEMPPPPDVGPQPSAAIGDVVCVGAQASVDVTVSNGANATAPAFFRILVDGVQVGNIVGPVPPGGSRTVTVPLNGLEDQTVTVAVLSGGETITSKVLTIDCAGNAPDVTIVAEVLCVNGAARGSATVTNNGNNPVLVTATANGQPLGQGVTVGPGATETATADLSPFEDQTITVRLFVDGAEAASYVFTPDCVAPEAVPGVSVSGTICPPPSTTLTLSNDGDPDSSIVFVIRIDGNVVQTSSPVFGGESTTIVGDLSRFEDQTVTVDLLANGELLGSRTIHVDCVTVAGAQGSANQPGAPRPPVAGTGATTSSGGLPSVGAGFSRSLLALGLALVGAGSLIVVAGTRPRRES